MEIQELLPHLPDLSWLKPMADEAMALIRNVSHATSVAYWEGFWQGSVTATLSLLVSWCMAKK